MLLCATLTHIAYDLRCLFLFALFIRSVILISFPLAVLCLIFQFSFIIIILKLMALSYWTLSSQKNWVIPTYSFTHFISLVNPTYFTQHLRELIKKVLM